MHNGYLVAPANGKSKKKCLIIIWKLLVNIWLLLVILKNFFHKKLATLCKAKIKIRKNTLCIRMQLIKMVKSCIEFNSQKRKATRENGGKDKKL